MKMALLRVGIDTGSGGIHGPLFGDNCFEFLPIPDKCGIDERTYGNTVGQYGRALVEYFPKRRRAKMMNQSLHFDPEFKTFTYGDPTRPKRSLRRLQPGDMLVFYCGLEGSGDCEHIKPALYIVGYFEVEAAGMADDFSPHKLETLFAENFHYRHSQVFEKDRGELVLVKGSPKSRLLKRAELLSDNDEDSIGRTLKVLSREKRKIFGDFGGKNSIQRSPPRWVNSAYVSKAAGFIRSLD